MHNPLIRPILDILKNTHEPLKEYELHKLLGGDSFAQFVHDCSEELILFRKHFLIMNALYELHEELLAQGLYIHISALDIRLIKINDDRSNAQAIIKETGFEKLSDYYRNWDNFAKTSEKEVSELLQSFWTRFLANEEKSLALDCLQLGSTATWPDIQQQYRRLCQQHHPDKGGDALYFLEIRQAYDNLKSIFDKNTTH